MTSPGPSEIANPTAASGLLVRRPRGQLFIDGKLLPIWFEITISRGLDQAMATADITVPHPLPDWVKAWSKVQIVAGAGFQSDPVPGAVGMATRFTGYINGFSNQLWPPAKILHCEDILWLAANTYPPEEVGI